MREENQARNGQKTPPAITNNVIASALGKAVSLHMSGKPKEALAELNAALENGPGSVEMYSARGHIQFELEMYDDAAKSYSSLLEQAPTHPTGAFNLAVCLEKLGRWQQASQRFQKAIEIDPLGPAFNLYF